MSARLLVLTTIGFLLLGSDAAEAGKRKRCRRTCGAVIADCVALGGDSRDCRRSTMRQCIHDPGFCRPVSQPTTSTTLPPTSISISIGTVETLFEVAAQVPAPGSQFVRVGIQVTTGSAASVPSTSVVLYTGGLGYTYYYAIYPPYPGLDDACSTGTIVAPGSSLTCHAIFQVPEGATRGYVELQGYGAGPLNTRTREFDIPTVPRPYAAVAVTGVEDGSPCITFRPGFRMVLIHLEISSHEGASELNQYGWGISLVAGGARYQPAYCTVEDPCDSRIGVPINGAATCTMSFEVPATMQVATIYFHDPRYPASTDFELP